MFGDDRSAKGDALLPYEKFLSRDFILRDWLAVDRTILANERTLLSYTRTALTLILAGLTFIRFLDRNCGRHWDTSVWPPVW